MQASVECEMAYKTQLSPCHLGPASPVHRPRRWLPGSELPRRYTACEHHGLELPRIRHYRFGRKERSRRSRRGARHLGNREGAGRSSPSTPHSGAGARSANIRVHLSSMFDQMRPGLGLSSSTHCVQVLDVSHVFLGVQLRLCGAPSSARAGY